MMQNMEESLQQQSGIGFSEKDIDDVRRYCYQESDPRSSHTYCHKLVYLYSLNAFHGYKFKMVFCGIYSTLHHLTVHTTI